MAVSKEFHLPFGVDYVVSIDLPDQKRWKAAKGFDMDCPFCMGKRKLNVNLEKNLWRCAKCDESGNTISLHAKLANLDNKEAYQDLMRRYKGLPANEKAKIKVMPKPEIEYIPALTLTRGLFYSAFLDNLSLSEKHRENLIKRGLTDEQIKKFGYKSCPYLVSSIVVKTLNETQIPLSMSNAEKMYLEKGQRYQIPGIAGFGNNAHTSRAAGYFVPVRNKHGEIVRMQIRRDMPDKLSEEEKESFARYITFSSGNEKEGVSSSGVENIHYVGFETKSVYIDDYKTPEVVCLTEGALKADVAHSLSGWAFIALMGVSSQAQLIGELEFLKKHGTKKIMICFDADYREKPSVADALKKAKEKIESVGLKYEMVNWDPKYKGIDDFLLARKQTRGE